MTDVENLASSSFEQGKFHNAAAPLSRNRKWLSSLLKLGLEVAFFHVIFSNFAAAEAPLHISVDLAHVEKSGVEKISLREPFLCIC